MESEQPQFKRRTDTEKVQVGEYFSSGERYYDQVNEITVVKVLSGSSYVTDKPDEMMVAVVGACVAICARDTVSNIGGMGHFMLPGSINNSDAHLRYGSYYIEKLIDKLLKMGADKSNLEIKIFGGAAVSENLASNGDLNVDFIMKYLRDEGLKAQPYDVGGTSPRRVQYIPHTGKFTMRKLSRKDDYRQVNEEEIIYHKAITVKVSMAAEGSVELF